MRIVPFLLRLLLCVSLVANGLAVAQGSAGMHLAPQAVAPDASAVSMAPAASGDCHEAISQAVGATDPVDGVVDTPEPTTMECCDGDACPCSCVAHVYFAIVSAAAPAHAAVQRDGGVLDALPRHRPPRLAHLIRPPIG